MYTVTFMFALRWSHKALGTPLSIGTPVWFLPGEQVSPSTSASPFCMGPAPPFHSHGERFLKKASSSTVLGCILSVSAVLNDIVSTMFNRKFMEELFKPQELYSKKALRTVYDRLAHASIIRLNQASMDKVSGRLPLWLVIDWSQMR